MDSDDSDTTPRVLGVVADIVRAATLLSVVLAWIWFGLGDALLFVVLFVGLLVPRLTRVPRPFDAAFGVTLLAASWSTVADWYQLIWWWDLFIHFVTNGAIAAMAYLVLARLKVVQDLHDRTLGRSGTAVVVLTTSFGLALGAIWEFLEWLVENLTPIQVHVGYDDSISDMAIGGLGSLLAGFALLAWAEVGRTVERGEDRT